MNLKLLQTLVLGDIGVASKVLAFLPKTLNVFFNHMNLFKVVVNDVGRDSDKRKQEYKERSNFVKI